MRSAGAGAGVGAAVGSAPGGVKFGFNDFGNQLVRGTLTGLAAGTTAAVMRGGRISVQQVATDAFGNALGSSLAGGSFNGASQNEAVLQGAGPWSERDYVNGLDLQSDNAYLQRQRDALYGLGGGDSGLGLRLGGGQGLAYRGVRASGYERELDFEAGPPRSGMKYTDRGWQNVDGSISPGVDGQLTADATKALKNQAEALGQGWRREGWSVLQGERPIAYDLANSTRTFLGAASGYDAMNAAQASFRQGNVGTGVVQTVQAFAEAGATVFGFGVAGGTATGLRVGGMTASELAAVRATYPVVVAGDSSALLGKIPYVQLGNTGQKIILTDEYAASQGWLVNSKGGLVTGQYLGVSSAEAEVAVGRLIQNGFPAKGSNLNVYQHIMGDGANSVFRGASLSPGVAAEFATGPGGYGVVLELGAVKGYDAARIVTDAPRALGSPLISAANTNLSMRANELEIVIRNDISLSNATGAKLFYRDPASPTAVPRFVRNINLPQ